MSAVFVPFFFFASVYAQAALGFSATNAGLFLLVFFGGFATASQWGGRIVDKRGARPAVILGCALSAVGFYLWGRQLPDLEFGSQWYWIVVAGAGLGLVLGPVSTDALNRAPGRRLRRGHRHHPDRAQPGRQPRPGRHGIAVRQRQRRPGRLDARGATASRPPRPTASRTRSPRAATPAAAEGWRHRPAPAPTRSCTPSRSTSPSPRRPWSGSWRGSWPRRSSSPGCSRSRPRSPRSRSPWRASSRRGRFCTRPRDRALRALAPGSGRRGAWASLTQPPTSPSP